MRLLENLRNAEQKSVKAMRQGMARAREEWGDMERRIRQRMRIYPRQLKKNAAITRPEITEDELENPIQELPEEKNASEAPTGRPIVSVHGQDVADEEFGKPAA
jgi:hypothetical protein